MRRGDSLDFSFSGLKTALVYKVRELGPERTLARRADLAASFQRAVVESLMLKLEQALERTGCRRLAIGGGVAANSLLRARVAELCDRTRPRAEDPAARALHGQRGDDRVGGEVLEPVPYPEFLAFDAFARSAA